MLPENDLSKIECRQGSTLDFSGMPFNIVTADWYPVKPLSQEHQSGLPSRLSNSVWLCRLFANMVGRRARSTDGASKSPANLATLSSKTGASHIVPWQLIVRGDKDRVPPTRRVKVICSRQTTSYLRSGVCISGDFMDSMSWYQMMVTRIVTIAKDLYSDVYQVPLGSVF